MKEQKLTLRPLGLYIMFDRVAEDASQPFVAVNDGIAKRIYDASLRDNPYGSDFRLFQIGELEGLDLHVVERREVFYGPQKEGE